MFDDETPNQTQAKPKKWAMDNDGEEDADFNEIDRILAFKKVDSTDVSNHRIYTNLKRQFTQLVEENPPLPILPKSVIVKSESPRSGGVQNFLKLTKFRGQDYGRSQFKEKDTDIEQVTFTQGTTTLRYIFQPLSQSS